MTPAAHQARSASPLGVRVGAKHVAVAVGVLVLVVGGLVYALMGDQPDFVCRLKSECREYGRCTGNRFSCIGGTTADCGASDVCRKDGLCSAGGGGCVAASDQDCAGSETCKKEEHCVQLDGRCTSEGQRTVIRTLEGQQTATKAVADYLKLLDVGARGGNTSIAVASFFAASQVEGYAVENPEPRVEAAEWGSATFSGRTLPAAVVRATFAEVNRSEGKRRRSCVVSAAINDKEFGMWRGLQAWSCTNARLTENLAAWRTEVSFKAQGSWAESSAVSLIPPPASPVAATANVATSTASAASPVVSASSAPAPARRVGAAPGKCKKDADCGGTGWCNPFGECDYRATER